MHRRMYAVVVAVVLTGFAFLLLTGRHLTDGPVLVRLGEGHGLHAGDLLVIAGWLLAMTALVLLTSRGPSRRS